MARSVCQSQYIGRRTNRYVASPTISSRCIRTKLSRILDDSIAEGDKVAIWYTAEGTHRGEFAGIPATGMHVRWSGVDLLTLEQGKITQARFLSDLFGLISQLSAKPAKP